MMQKESKGHHLPLLSPFRPKPKLPPITGIELITIVSEITRLVLETAGTNV